MLQPEAVILSLRTTQFKAMLAFYSQLLGKPTVPEAGDWARFDMPGCELVLWQTKAREESKDNLQLCFRVTDLEKSCQRIGKKENQLEIQVASHGREVFFPDPDGNLLILYQPHHSNNEPPDGRAMAKK